MTKNSPSTPPSAARRRELAMIHIARKALALQDDDYRALVARVAVGKTSSADLTPGERGRLLDEFRRLGWAGPLKSTARARHDYSHRAEIRLMHALWRSLWLLGVTETADARALDAFVERQTGLAAARFVPPEQAHQVIEGLKAMCARAGFTVPERLGPGGVEAKRSLVRALWTRLGDAGALRVPERDGLDAWISHRIVPRRDSVNNLDADRLDRAAEELGAWLRRVL